MWPLQITASQVLQPTCCPQPQAFMSPMGLWPSYSGFRAHCKAPPSFLELKPSALNPRATLDSHSRCTIQAEGHWGQGTRRQPAGIEKKQNRPKQTGFECGLSLLAV